MSPENVIAGQVALSIGAYTPAGQLAPGPVCQRRARLIVAALRAAGYVVEQGWQPIGTAPMDGTPFSVGRWESYGWVSGEAVYRDRALQVWWTRRESDVEHIPTHWCPLRQPPAVQETDRE